MSSSSSVPENAKRSSSKPEDGSENSSRKDEVVYGITSLKSAAHEAAMADGLIPVDAAVGESKAKKAGLRRGKWTAEEESYANRLIYEFKLGLLPLTDGTTLRTFLSKLLNCDPMRISKKFVGQNCIGKQVFRRRQQDLEKLTPEQIETSRKELAELERKFLERVAQTNRTKTSSGIKDGRPGYEDEDGNPILAPWMLPPDEVAAGAANHSSENGSGGRNGSSNNSVNPSSSSGYSNDQNGYLNANSGSFAPNRVMAAYAANPEGANLDYQQMISMNNAMMSQLYHGMPPSGSVPYFIPPGYPAPTGMVPGGKLESGGPLPRPPSFDVFYNMDPNRMVHGPNGMEAGGLAYRGSFPWVGSSEGIAAYGSSVSLPFASHDWPSMTNLINSGESMENIAQFLTQYQTPGNTEGTPGANSDSQRATIDKDSKDNDRDKANRTNDDVGLSLDDPAPSSASKGFGFNGNWKVPANKSNEPEKVPEKPSISRNSTDSYSIPTDSMAVMAPMYSRQTTESKSSSSFPAKTAEPPQASPALGLGASPATSSAIPRNSSVENFWMLVDMGDLPRPDQGVLSETLWQAKTSAVKPDFAKPGKPELNGNTAHVVTASTRIVEKTDMVHAKKDSSNVKSFVNNGISNNSGSVLGEVRKRPDEVDSNFSNDPNDHLLKKIKVEHGTSSA